MLGSNLHAIRTFDRPRWEDYNFECLDPPFADGKQHKKNRFYWLGNGATYNELHDTGDCAWYLDDECVDYPPGKFAFSLADGQTLLTGRHSVPTKEVASV